MSGTIYEDLIEEFILKNKNTSEEKKTLVMKTVAVLVGVVGTLLVLLINKTESIFEMSFALPGITNGAILTLFVAGLFIPRVNSKGVLAGAGTSLIVMAWLLLNTQYFIISKNLRYPTKFTRVDQCPGNYSTDPKVLSRLETWRGYSSPTVADDNVPYVYQISYMYYTPLGFMIGTIVAILVSMLTKPPTQRNLDLKLISPYVHKFLPSQRKNVEMTELASVIGNKKMADNNEKLLVKEQQNDED